MDVYEWLFIAEEHARKIVLASPTCREYGGDCVLVPRIITSFDCYESPVWGEVCKTEKLDYDAIPVAAFYPMSRVNEDFVVRVGSSEVMQLVVPKLSGADWIPLVMKTQYAYIRAGSHIVIEPKPEVMLILEMQPRGVTLVQIIDRG